VTNDAPHPPATDQETAASSELALVDTVLASYDGSWPPSLVRVGEILQQFPAPADRATKWAAWTIGAPSDVGSAAIRLSLATQLELPALVRDEPIMLEEGVRQVLLLAASLRPNAELRSLVEALERCSEIDTEAAFEERALVAAAYDNLIDHPYEYARQLDDFALLRLEGARRESPWLLVTATRVGAALTQANPRAMVIDNATTWCMLANVYVLHGRVDEARACIAGALTILERVSTVDSAAAARPLELAHQLERLIDAEVPPPG
jgi:hypothetical protein